MLLALALLGLYERFFVQLLLKFKDFVLQLALNASCHSKFLLHLSHFMLTPVSASSSLGFQLAYFLGFFLQIPVLSLLILLFGVKSLREFLMLLQEFLVIFHKLNVLLLYSL